MARSIANNRSTANNRKKVINDTNSLNFDGTGDYLDCGGAVPKFLNKVSESIELDFDQGFIINGEFNYLINRDFIKKTDSEFNVILSNTDVHTEVGEGTNHLGDGDIYDGKLYIPNERWVNCGDYDTTFITIWDADDLSLLDKIDISAQGHEVSGLTVDEDYIYIVSFCDGSKIWRYNRLTGAYVDAITLDKQYGGTQGITIKDNKFFMVWTNTMRTYSMDGTLLTASVSIEADEGLDVYDDHIYSLNSGENKIIKYSTNNDYRSGSISVQLKVKEFFNYNTIFDTDISASYWEMWVYNTGQLRGRIKDDAYTNTNLVDYDIDKWITITFQWREDKTIEIWVNDVLRDTSNSPIWIDPGTFYIAGGNGSNTKGKITVNNVRIFNKALEENEIKDLYYRSEYNRDYIVSEYLLNEGSGTSAGDTYNNNNATIVNATWITETPTKQRSASTSRSSI